MKRKLVLAVLALAVLFSGCSMPGLQFNTVSDLMRPPKSTDDDQGLNDAIEQMVGADYVLKSPLSGAYHSAYVLQDLDGDGQEEALVFFEYAAAPEQANLLLFRQEEGDWVAVQEVEGQGDNVHMVAFGDLNGNGTMEIMVGWQVLSNRDKQYLSVYSYSKAAQDKNAADAGDYELNEISSDLTYSAFQALDIDGDGTGEFLILSIETGASQAEARAHLYTVNRKNQVEEMGVAAMDSSVYYYANLLVQEDPYTEGCIVYVDGYKGESAMVTEILYWDAEAAPLPSPLYDAQTENVTKTMKDARLESRDATGDGLVDVALIREALPGRSSESVRLVWWANVNIMGEILYHQPAIVNEEDGYMLFVDKTWTEKVTVVTLSETGRRIWNFYEWNFDTQTIGEEVCSILTMAIADWNQSDIENFEVIGSNGNLIYAARIGGESKSVSISMEELKEQFYLYD
ncbi:MAG: VCBS repeat-containing protein [Clostridiales bacterium]|nr:VCBS repeat-containing protein [Clostridiales bacterium]